MPSIESILISHDIKFWKEGKNVTPGWTNIKCPFCGDKSNHGGFSPEGSYNCWRCGNEHSASDVIKEITGFDIKITTSTGTGRNNKTKKQTKRKEYDDMPGSAELMECHKMYLKNRGLDPTMIQDLYRIKGTNHTPIKYQWRIMIPIFNNSMEYLGFQGRDITGRQIERYKCESDTDNKEVLYGEWLIDNRKNILVVEGVFDVWKLGVGAVCTFGIAFTRKQIILLSEYENVFIMFDNEKRAQNQAKKLSQELSILGVNSIITKLPSKYKDAGSMPQKIAKELKEEIFRKRGII